MRFALHRPTTRRVLGVALAAAGGVLLAAARPPAASNSTPAPRASGVTFSYRVSSANADAKVRDARNLVATVRMQDGNIRMDYLDGMSPLGKKNGYMLVLGDGSQFVIVDPSEKKATVMSADLLGSGLGAALNNPMIKMSFSNVSFRYKDLGTGEPLLGYKTRKVRTWYTSTLEMKVMMMNQKTVTSDSSDQWIATVDMEPRTLEAWAKSFAAGVKSTNPDLVRDIASYTREYGRTGMALKTVTWSSRTDGKGKVMSDSTVVEITAIKTGALDNALFVVPADYQVTDMSKMMADARAQMDSAKGDGAKGGADGAKDDKKIEKPSAKDAIKAGLGGLLRKKPPM